MSYSRFGWDGSNVYVFDDTRGGTTCCWCALHPEIGEDFNVATHAEMVDHMREHIAAGHTVPSYVIPELESTPDGVPMAQDRP